MCGIAGFISFGAALGEDTLLRMNESIRRRGPDGAGHFFERPVGLAMRRLAVIDLQGGWQPIYNEDRSIAVVFNGEIYNYRTLRQHLQSKGHRFGTDSDTEVIVHLYEEYGLDAPVHLSGMFAFALWDRSARRLVVARDRLGIKPLYYSHRPDAFYFGSEIKVLTAAGAASSKLDPQAIDEYFTYTNVPTPRTIYADIRQIAPGHVVAIGADGRVESRAYWQIPAVAPERRTLTDWMNHGEAAIRRAVESHLVSDVPIGAFLSGGVDSGLMVALMADILGPRVETFTVSFADAGAAFIDERVYSRALAERYKLKYHEIEITPDFEAIAAEIATAFDQPFADDSVIPTYYISKVARQHVTVALTGLGGDELFGGYRRHLGLLLSAHYSRLPTWMRRSLIAPVVNRLGERGNSSDTIDHIKRFSRADAASPSARYADYMSAIGWEGRRSLYSREFAEQIDARTTLDVIAKPFDRIPGSNDVLARALRTDLATYLVDDVLTLSDRISMWHSLELRVPFVDHELVEFAATIPSDLKIRGLTQKYLLKRIAEKWLPREMIYHKKQGFEAPMGRWLRGPLLPFFDSVVTEAAVRHSGVFDFQAIQRLRDEHVAQTAKHSKLLFSVLSFLLWQRSAATGLA